MGAGLFSLQAQRLEVHVHMGLHKTYLVLLFCCSVVLLFLQGRKGLRVSYFEIHVHQWYIYSTFPDLAVPSLIRAPPSTGHSSSVVAMVYSHIPTCT